jgi:predicted CXXCH cytochrome family protein
MLAILFFCAVDCRAGTGFSIQFPPDNSFVENEEIGIVLTMEKPVLDGIRVVTGKSEPTEIPVRPGGTNACLGVTLNKGMNSIELLGLQQGKIVERKKMNIFFRSDLFPQFREPPAGFQRYFFHFIDNEKSCVGCHDMEPALSSLRPENPDKSPCYVCHVKKYTHKAFVHNPAARGTCFTCHDVLEGERKYTVPKPDEKMCYPCHSSEVKGWKTRKVMHGPTAVGHCTLCHNPHGSEWPGLLRMQATDLCINCHEDKASGTHVIAGIYGKGHPVRGVRDPSRPDREFTCAGCHNPHAGNTQNLLNHDNSNSAEYCIHCHKF